VSIWKKLKDYFLQEKAPHITFQPEWCQYLENNLPLYSRLPESLKLKLHDKIAAFVSATYFEGCGGLELDDEMILTVAAQACMLILNHDGAPYPRLNTVLLYPSSFSSKVKDYNASGITTERRVHRLGESWSNGTVILAWDSVSHGAANIYDGHNVTFHEFAHQLDSENGPTDGVPQLSTPEAYQTWGTILSEGYAALCQKANRRKKTVLDAYGTTNIAEYFAVATEAFFEKPRQLKKKQPTLYAELKDFYQLDPVEWFISQ
jgi:Mlc titration factor MtfA (ptsG expression regulator)